MKRLIALVFFACSVCAYGQKLSDLPSVTSLSGTEIVPIVPVGSTTAKKVTLNLIWGSIPSLAWSQITGAPAFVTSAASGLTNNSGTIELGNSSPSVATLAGETRWIKASYTSPGVPLSSLNFIDAKINASPIFSTPFSVRYAGFNIGQGSTGNDPDTPIDGDMWLTNIGQLKWRGAGTTYTSFVSPLTTTGDLMQYSGSGVVRLPSVATGNVLISGGVGTINSWGKVGLTTHISGTLAVGNGGTGATTLTGILKGNGTSAFTAATAGTDYENPLTFSNGLTRTSNAIALGGSISSTALFSGTNPVRFDNTDGTNPAIFSNGTYTVTSNHRHIDILSGVTLNNSGLLYSVAGLRPSMTGAVNGFGAEILKITPTLNVSSFTGANFTGINYNPTITNIGSGFTHYAAIFASGNVGIGTTSPSSLLTVNGAAAINSLTLTTPLPVTSGGTGTSTPGLVAGTNVTISGTWPNQTINATGGGSSALSSITAATATNTIDNANFSQTWNWNTLSGAGMTINASSTAAAGNAQALFNVSLGGLNATTNQTTYAARFNNTHTGTLSTNIALQLDAQNGTTNTALRIGSGDISLNGASGSSGQVLTSAGPGAVPTWNSALTNPMTTVGDVIVGGTAGAATRLALGANGTFLGVSGGVIGYYTPSGGSGLSNVVGTDANITAAVQTRYHLPPATLTAGRNFVMPAGTNGDIIKVYNNEAGFIWTLTGSAVYLADNTTILTTLLVNANYEFEFINGRWRILN